MRTKEGLLSGRATKGRARKKPHEENTRDHVDEVDPDDHKDLLPASFHSRFPRPPGCLAFTRSPIGVFGHVVRLGLQEGVPPVGNLGPA